MRSRALTMLLGLAGLAFSPVAPAGPGVLDPTFGSFGVTDVRGFGGTALLVQRDGKLVMAGVTAAGSAGLVRLDTNGAIDPSFGIDGVAVVPLASKDAQATALALQPDGKILAVGYYYTEFHEHAVVFLARYHADGNVDSSYGRDGIVEFSILPVPVPVDNVLYPDYVGFAGLAAQSDGKALIGGAAFSTAGTHVVFLIRCNPDGSLDATFGDGGMTLTITGYPLQVTYGPLLQANGGILMFADTSVEERRFVAVRFGADGHRDSSFGTAGLAPLPFPVTHALLQGDGRILAASGQSGPPVLRVARLLQDATLDAAFGTGGVAAAQFGGCRPPGPAHIDPCPQGRTQIALQPDGRIVQTGRAFDGVDDVPALARYNSNGSPDPDFGIDGRITGPRGVGGQTNAIDPDRSRLYVGGIAYACCADRVARFLLVVTPATIAIASDANPSAPGQPVTMTATVTGQAPDGVVSFRDDGNAIAGCQEVPLSVVGPTLARASCASTLPPGSHSLSVVYLGNGTNSPNTSAPTIQRVGESAGTLAVEYFNASSGDYFVTADPDEIAKLGAGASPGWLATGEAFRIFPAGTARTKPMCRYWSGAAFTPKDSHFFGASATDCAVGYPWQFEGDVLPIMLPALDGTCLSGTAPLYRLYNGGRGGVPHHRYTTSAAVRAAMVQQGWTPEGAGIGVTACASL
jgi:uncharacterized delta-60 repeat protein